MWRTIKALTHERSLISSARRSIRNEKKILESPPLRGILRNMKIKTDLRGKFGFIEILHAELFNFSKPFMTFRTRVGPYNI